jgi:HK97 family phage major capsid protein
MEGITMNKQQILKRMREIAELLKADGADVAALETEYRALLAKVESANLQEEIAAAIQSGEQETRQMDGIETPEAKPKDADAEKRGKNLLEKRAVTVAASNVIVPTHTSSTITPTFNEVSSLIDRVNTVTIVGGEAYSQPYIKGYGTGDYTGEGENYIDAEPTFGYAEIGKAKVTAYAEDTEEIRKLPAANYDAVVQGGISKAMRKKITREIMVGDGAANHFTGIFHNPADAAKQVIDPATDLEIIEIGVDTLDDIVFSFGGDEDVEAMAVLILSKKDLRAFAKLRGVDKKKLHEIKTQGNTGTIDGVPFIINSACKPLSDTATAAGAYSMAYGPLVNYQKVIFSDVEIAFSTDYKFKQGNIAHRGSVFMGGNVVARNGFLRVKKGTA